MSRRIKNYFIPNHENEYAPHVLHTVSAAVMFVLILLSFSLANLQSILWLTSDWLVSAVLPAVIVELTNEEREGQSLQTLQRNPVLDRAAALKAADMAKYSYFAHNSPAGLTPWYWFDAVGYEFTYAGENLAVHFTDSEELVTAWMNSPGHRANMLGNKYTEIGVGTAQGTYEGYATVFVVQLFGTPLVSAASPVGTGESVEPAAQQFASLPPESIPEPVPTSAAILSEETAETEPRAQFQDESPVPNTESQPINESDVAPEEPIVLYSDLATTSRVGDSATPLSVGGETSVSSPSSWAKAATQPRMLLQIFYSILASFVVVALILSIVIEWRRQHPVQIAYGAGLLAAMFLLLSVHLWLTTTVVIV